MECYEFTSELHPCSYFKDRQGQFHYFCIKDCSTYFYKGLLERGYRRFGEFFFVPRCPECKECITIRHLVSDFTPSANMLKVMKKNKETLFAFKRPLVNDARVCLYVKYHLRMAKKKGWSFNNIDMQTYRDTFVEGAGEFGYEMCLYRDGRLIGVSYFDIVQDSLSAIYFFYDHDYEHLSLGTLNILLLFSLAKRLNLKYFYPGYWIKDHHSMGYKERFKPFEMLTNEADIFDKTQYKLYKTHQS
ncbi:arginyltransferase [Helicobacter sp. 11S02629-2]|uniref:arginyltransferase n=1 Tax=Helicobacter sp. 11S02629-2 TaxID=1476195 RepID=UPI000BA6903D|nr:arginyltransferase [Helicobacter sp. 11S02629-2]PAF44345.1 arginyltransferase [Helicobacter sp. 11S02629-2]